MADVSSQLLRQGRTGPDGRVTRKGSNIDRPDKSRGGSKLQNQDGHVLSGSRSMYEYSNVNDGYSHVNGDNGELGTLDKSCQPFPVKSRSCIDLLTRTNDNNDMRGEENGNTSMGPDDGHRQWFQQNNQRLYNRRGLKSATDIPNVIDNRYMILNQPAEQTQRVEAPMKPRRSRNTTTSSHGHYNKNHKQSSVHHSQHGEYQNDAYYDNDYYYTKYDIDQDTNLEELENIPSIDDIPYALILTGVLDEETLKKARQKQWQQIALENIQKQSEVKQKRGTSTNKNMEPNTFNVSDRSGKPPLCLQPNTPYESDGALMNTLSDLCTEQGISRGTSGPAIDGDDGTINGSFEESVQQFNKTIQTMQPEHVQPQSSSKPFLQHTSGKVKSADVEKVHATDTLNDSVDIEKRTFVDDGTSESPHIPSSKETKTPSQSDLDMKIQPPVMPTEPPITHGMTLHQSEHNEGQELKENAIENKPTTAELNHDNTIGGINRTDTMDLMSDEKPELHHDNSHVLKRTKESMNVDQLQTEPDEDMSAELTKPTEEQSRHNHVVEQLHDTVLTENNSGEKYLCNVQVSEDEGLSYPPEPILQNSAPVSENNKTSIDSTKPDDTPPLSDTDKHFDEDLGYRSSTKDESSKDGVCSLKDSFTSDSRNSTAGTDSADDVLPTDNRTSTVDGTLSTDTSATFANKNDSIRSNSQNECHNTPDELDSDMRALKSPHLMMQIGAGPMMFRIEFVEQELCTSKSPRSSSITQRFSITDKSAAHALDQHTGDGVKGKTHDPEFIRMKRLEKLTDGNVNDRHQTGETTGSDKTTGDKGIKAEKRNNDTKPIKPKAFRHIRTFNVSDEEPDGTSTTSFPVNSNTQGSNESQDYSKPTVPIAMQLSRTNRLNRTSEDALNSPRQNNGNQKPSTLNESRTKSNKPSQSKNLRARYEGRRPAAMRLLMKMKGREKRLSRSSSDFDESAFPLSLLSLLTGMVHGNPFTESTRKQPKVNNKNQSPFKSTRSDPIGMKTKTTDREVLDKTQLNDPKPTVSKTVNKNATQTKTTSNDTHRNGQLHNDNKPKRLYTESSVTATNESTPTPSVRTMSPEELRHEAFRRLKLRQSVSQPKCAACGRSECEGQNIKQMQTMVRLARETGYEIRDVSPDGNCMFAAVVDQLTMYGDLRFDAKSLREAAVYRLVENPYSADGTHYNNFISTEWDTYIQKMHGEGEWGDHVILKAVVEVVGHTIKVFNVSGDTSFWTKLEPSTVDVSNDGVHLVLGLVGEFHYTSLRPADTVASYVPPSISPGTETSDVANMTDIKLDGGETVDMFQDDYIDDNSGVPVAHFSYLLKTVIPMKYVHDAASVSSEMIDQIKTSNSDYKCQFYGPAADGVYHHYIFANRNAQSDTNAMVESMAFFIREPSSSMPISIFDIKETYPGFATIESEMFGVKFPGSSYPMANGSTKTWTSIKSVCFEHWPDSAKSWICRPRREGWPSKEIVDSISAGGFTVVPHCHPMRTDEYQVLFVEAEHTLFREAMSTHQKYCFIMFIGLCEQTLYECKTISYRHIKNVFFYACERVPAQYWETRPGSCVLYMIDTLMRCLKARNLPNYFIDKYNMIDHLTDTDVRDLQERLSLLRSNPVLFLKDINANCERYQLIDSIIDRVTENIPQFVQYPDLKMTTLRVFVPSAIDLAHGYIGCQNYTHGCELLSSSFQERLAISTCDEMISYEMFLLGAVSGLDLNSLVWFSAYADKQFEGQLSKSLIRETCGDLELTPIQTILPAEVCGSFANTEVPMRFGATPCEFCAAFVRFLFSVEKMSDILSVLQYCHRMFKEKLERFGSDRNPSRALGTQYEDFNEYNMFDIYTAMFQVKRQQGQLATLNSVLSEIRLVCEQLGTRPYFACLKYIYHHVGDEVGKAAANAAYEQLPVNDNEQYVLNRFHSWPRLY